MTEEACRYGLIEMLPAQVGSWSSQPVFSHHRDGYISWTINHADDHLWDCTVSLHWARRITFCIGKQFCWPGWAVWHGARTGTEQETMGEKFLPWSQHLCSLPAGVRGAPHSSTPQPLHPVQHWSANTVSYFPFLHKGSWVTRHTTLLPIPQQIIPDHPAPLLNTTLYKHYMCAFPFIIIIFNQMSHN